jgi:hypothetical protein
VGWAAASHMAHGPIRRLHPHRPVRSRRQHRVRRFSFDPSHASEASGGRGCPERRQARSRDGCGPRASRPPRLVRSVWGRSTGSVRVRVRVRERGGGENEGASTSTKAASTTTRAKPPTQRPSRGRPTSPAGSPPKVHPTPPPRAKRVGEVPSNARGGGARCVGRRVRATGPPLPPTPTSPSGRPQPHLQAPSPRRISPRRTPHATPDPTRTGPISGAAPTPSCTAGAGSSPTISPCTQPANNAFPTTCVARSANFGKIPPDRLAPVGYAVHSSVSVAA